MTSVDDLSKLRSEEAAVHVFPGVKGVIDIQQHEVLTEEVP